ncbi:hypothetical protein A3Q56_01116, partial [Intoshia linei]
NGKGYLPRNIVFDFEDNLKTKESVFEESNEIFPGNIEKINPNMFVESREVENWKCWEESMLAEFDSSSIFSVKNAESNFPFKEGKVVFQQISDGFEKILQKRLEECDRFQGFMKLFDISTGYCGFEEQIMSVIEDYCPRRKCISFPIFGNQNNDKVEQIMNTMISVYQENENNLNVPLVMEDDLFKTFDNSELKKFSEAIDTCTLCLRNPALDIDIFQLFSILKQPHSKSASLSIQYGNNLYKELSNDQVIYTMYTHRGENLINEKIKLEKNGHYLQYSSKNFMIELKNVKLNDKFSNRDYNNEKINIKSTITCNKNCQISKSLQSDIKKYTRSILKKLPEYDLDKDTFNEIVDKIYEKNVDK